MIRNLKALGFSLVAVFAMGALGASGASATDFFTTANGQPVILTGVSHDNVLSIGNTKIECTTKRVASTIVNGASEVTVDADYVGKVNATPHGTPCNGTGGDITVDMNGCHYILTGNTIGPDAPVWITCPIGKVIQITQPGTGATITIPAQTPLFFGVTYTNILSHAGGAAIKVTTIVTGIAYTCHGFACHFGPGTSGSNAKSSGTVTLTGYGDSEGLPTPVSEGSRVGVEVS